MVTLLIYQELSKNHGKQIFWLGFRPEKVAGVSDHGGLVNQMNKKATVKIFLLPKGAVISDGPSVLEICLFVLF